MNEAQTEKLQIDDIRLAVLRAVKDLLNQHGRNVRSIEIFKHPLLGLEEGKRISNTLYTCKDATPALLIADVSGNYELTAAGFAYLDKHANVALDQVPVSEANRRREGNGLRVNDPAARRPLGREPLERKPLATRPTQLPPIPELKPGQVTYVPDENHVSKTIAELQKLAQRHEEQAAKLRNTIEMLRQALLDKPPEIV